MVLKCNESMTFKSARKFSRFDLPYQKAFQKTFKVDTLIKLW